jgi:hypothetical protein
MNMKESYHKELTFRKASPPGASHEPNWELSRKQRNSPTSTVRARNAAVFSAIIYPNGEFGMGYIKCEKKRADDKRYDNGIVNGIKSTLVPREHELEDGTKLYDSGDMHYDSYILDSPHESSQTKPYGTKGITPYGKKMIRNAVFIIEGILRRPGDLPQFSTLTLPPLSPECEKYICSVWANLQRRFFQECRRKYQKHGRNFHYASCTEIQPKRWKESRFVGLHLHFVYNAIYSQTQKNWVITDTWVRETWCRIINDTLRKWCQTEGLTPPQFSWISYRREKITKSAEAYIGKYISKGGDIIPEVLEEKGVEYLPKQWWSMSSYVRCVINLKTIKSRDDILVEHLVNCIKNNDENIIYSYPSLGEVHDLSPDGSGLYRTVIYGYGGKMHPELLRECKHLCKISRKDLTKYRVTS